MRKIGLTLIAIFVFLTTLGQELDKEFVKANKIKLFQEYSHKIDNDTIISSELKNSLLFDEKANLIEKQGYIYSEVKKIKYEYNSMENLIKEIHYKSDGSEYEIKIWDYDNNGRLLKHISKLYWEKKPFISNYVYNEQGQNIEQYDIDEQGEKYRILTKEYYDSGELFEERFEYKKHTTNWILRYDKCGNVIYKYGGVKGQANPNIKYLDSCKVDSTLRLDTVRYFERRGEITRITELRLSEYWFLPVRNVKILDNNGNLIINERYEYERDSIVRHSEISFFNEQGQLVEKKTFYSWKNIFESDKRPDSRYLSKYEYYENGLLRFEYYSNAKEEIEGYWESEYYDNGLRKRRTDFNEKGMKTGYTEYGYYDNGLRKFVNYFNEKGVKTQNYEFKIEYY